MFDILLRRLFHLLLFAVWLSGSVLAAIWSLIAGVALFGGGLFLFYWAYRKGFFVIPRSSRETASPADAERDAKSLVTQILRSLTRVQVSYLCQSFGSRSESRSWLKNALPRSFRANLDELHSKLESARLGHEIPGLRLAQRVLERREWLMRTEELLKQAHERHPDHAISHPVIFVVTEHLGAESDAEPEVTTVAGWNPAEATLLPRVDSLTFLSEVDGGKQVRGQATFLPAMEALAARVKLLDEKQGIYAAEAVDDPARYGVQLSKVPLGFVIGAAELV